MTPLDRTLGKIRPVTAALGSALNRFLKIVKALLRPRILKRIFTVAAILLVIVCILAYRELQTSAWQAKIFSKIAAESTFKVEDGPSDHIRFPSFGPYDIRLGYTKIPNIISSLGKNDYVISKQARISSRMEGLFDSGFYPPFREKTRAGLTILDRRRTTIYSTYRPERFYESLADVPRMILGPLLFIENREILNQKYPTKNPAVEWDRLFYAVMEKMWQIIRPGTNAPGGSTIATQLEKYRHSREGRTGSIRDKFLQMGSASLSAYMNGIDTTESRKQIILQYVNSIPLAALPLYGEVNGLGDGLWAWYGADFEATNIKLKQLENLDPNAEVSPDLALNFKQALSLFIAHRRPSYYLLSGINDLNALTNTYLDLLANQQIIPRNLAEAGKKVRLDLRRAAPKPSAISFVQRKAANAIRTRLLSLLNYPQLYDLDQVDLSVLSTMDNNANEAVTDVLRQIKDADSVKKLGLSGARNLDRGDPSKVIYSLTLYERVGNANLLRVQTDNFDKPFSINEGTRLDLGSTAKLRTLTTYLSAVGDLHEKFHGASTKVIQAELNNEPDPITTFAVSAIKNQPDISLDDLLELAMQRTYSANPGESFFTGGGIHHFENFKKEDNGRVPTIKEAITNSINLPFVRLMRDVVRYYIHSMGLTGGIKDKEKSEVVRMNFLKKFADQEGSYFMRTFYTKYRGKKPSDLLPFMVDNSRASPRHAVVMYRYIRPEASMEEMSTFLQQHLKGSNLTPKLLEKFYNDFGPGKFNLNDTGYLARIHPLELWLVKYMQDHPGAPLSEMLESSKDERQQVYEWLFKTPHRGAQDSRIKTLVEVEAFTQIHKQWRKMGYPFASMVPSYASAIGSSGDRPVALAELVGIILNDGYRLPLVRLEQLHFAQNTPYETIISRTNPELGERVLKSEVAAKLREAMVSVVENGTARRVFKAFKQKDGSAFVIGGKTGTGDHRYEVYGAGGRLISSRVVNRTATFAFFIGDRYFGVISAHVPGPEAAKFDFTSALAAELLKILSPALSPMIEESGTKLSPVLDRTASSLSAEKNITATPTEAATPMPDRKPKSATQPAPSPIAKGKVSKNIPVPTPTKLPTARPAPTSTKEKKKVAPPTALPIVVKPAE